ncbi:hypothetical protein BEP19_08310 [Ammoniphilus oxalaticus]|uniref:Uncharacterized protein n=1 Tax=Ammoniphilus oxalaticus TaxID=66863 RepID=A0A419SK81_9BACL|nr:hypothetical protein [Ammoniphilus oxalaticus]RKD24387.1 hypothetical protein BEP19_08310 [Ammoniphilus oxalaticus]
MTDKTEKRRREHLKKLKKQRESLKKQAKQGKIVSKLSKGKLIIPKRGGKPISTHSPGVRKGPTASTPSST